MAERLSGGNAALALMANTVATGTALMVLIAIFEPISGAHFNPAVTLYFALRREAPPPMAVAYVTTQIACAVAGVFAAHAMFGSAIFEISRRLRDGPNQTFSEFVATFGLIATIAGSVRYRPALTPFLVGLYIMSAYWFTASTSFANPAVTIARSLSDSFAGIAPHSAPAFIVAQLLATLAGYFVFGWIFARVADVRKMSANEHEVAAPADIVPAPPAS